MTRADSGSGGASKERRFYWGPFAWYSRAGIGWFRVFGYGLWWKDSSRHRLLFSQRQKLSRYWKVGGWLFEVLRP